MIECYRIQIPGELVPSRSSRTAHVDRRFELALNQYDQMSNPYDNIDFFDPLSMPRGRGCGKLRPEFDFEVAPCDGVKASAFENRFKKWDEPDSWAQIFQPAKGVRRQKILATLVGVSFLKPLF